MTLDVVRNHPEYDIGWSVLSLLSLLAENPTGCLSDSLVTEDVHLPDTSLSISMLQAQDDTVDWYSYLREGDEKFQIPFNESLDEWSDDEQTESKLSDSQSADVVTVVFKYEKDVQKPSGSTVTIHQMPSILSRNDLLSNRYQGSNKQFYHQLVRRKMRSLEKLKSNVQNTWWNDPGVRQLPLSKVRDAQLAILWEKFNRFEEKLNIVSEYKLVREFLWSLFVYSSNAMLFRPYYSVCSARPDTLKTFLLPKLETLALFREMASFRNLLSDSVCSHSLRVYASALEEILRPLGEKFVLIERLVRKEQSKVTLLSLSVDLEKDMQDVRFIYYNIHAHVTKDWQETAHHLQAHNVLQVLFHNVQKASSNSCVSICTTLLVHCLSVSLEVVDILMSEGRIYDPSNEFFLVSSMENEIKCRVPFTSPSPYHTSEILRSYYEETESSANSFVLVEKLNKLVALNDYIQNKGKLYADFVRILITKFPRPGDNSTETHGRHSIKFQLDSHHDVETTIRAVLLDLIQVRKTTVTCFIKKQLLDSYNLFHHLQVLYRVLLIDTEYPYLTVYKYILELSESDLDWRNEFHLSQMLEECLDTEFPQFSSQFSISLSDEDSESHVLEFINLISINFKVGLPVDLILTPKCMVKYNLIFRFILKMKWALSLVQSLQFQDITGRDSSMKQKLYLLRHSLLHVICTLHSHHMCLLLQIFSVDLQKDLLRVQTVETLVQVHERHLTTALFHCLLLPKQSPLQQSLNKILCLSESLKGLWTSTTECNMKNLDQLKLRYMKATWNFTELLHRSIPSSSHQVYNSIFDLWSCMVSSSPAHNITEEPDD